MGSADYARDYLIAGILPKSESRGRPAVEGGELTEPVAAREGAFLSHAAHFEPVLDGPLRSFQQKGCDPSPEGWALMLKVKVLEFRRVTYGVAVKNRQRVHPPSILGAR